MNIVSREKWRVAGIGLLVVLVTFAVFSPSIGYNFIHLDDGDYVTENPMVKDGFSWGALKMAWTETAGEYWAPLLWMSFMLDIELFGMTPWGCHLTNVFLFALNAGLLFWLVRRWTGRTGVGLAVALLWALHPARVESVAWVTERKDVLSGLFFLLGMGAYVEGRRGTLKWGVALAWLCMALGGMVKQIVMVMPAALMLLDAWPLDRTDWNRIWRDGWRSAKEKWAFWGLAGILACLPIWFHHESGGLLDIPVGYRLKMIPIHYLFYFQKVLWPSGLAVLQGDLTFRWWTFALGLGILGGVTWGLWQVRTGARWALMGWLWFVGLLFPLSGVVWAGAERLATRFMYLPQIGLTLAVVLAADEILRRRRIPWRWGAMICALLVATYAGLSLHLLPNWRNSQAIFMRVLRVNPYSLHGFDNLCRTCYQTGKYAEWQEVLERFHREQPENPVAGIQYAWWMAAMIGKPDEGIEAWERVTGLSPETWDFWVRLEGMTDYDNIIGLWQDVAGIWLRQKGDLQQMKRLRAHWEGKWDERPQGNFLEEMLQTCWTAGRETEATALAQDIAALGKGWPTRKGEMAGRFIARWEQGARGYAFAGFVDCAKWAPEDGATLNNMAWLLATAEPDGLSHARMDEWPATALSWAERALALSGGDIAGVWDTLAAARANAGDFNGAVTAAEQALTLAKRSGEGALASKLLLRREGYRAGKPWREAVKRIEEHP